MIELLWLALIGVTIVVLFAFILIYYNDKKQDTLNEEVKLFNEGVNDPLTNDDTSFYATIESYPLSEKNTKMLDVLQKENSSLQSQFTSLRLQFGELKSDYENLLKEYGALKELTESEIGEEEFVKYHSKYLSFKEFDQELKKQHP